MDLENAIEATNCIVEHVCDEECKSISLFAITV